MKGTGTVGEIKTCISLVFPSKLGMLFRVTLKIKNQGQKISLSVIKAAQIFIGIGFKKCTLKLPEF